MDKDSKSYHANWWFPNDARQKKYTGTLFFEENGALKLHIYFTPEDYHGVSRFDHNAPIIHGLDACNNPFTLFDCVMEKMSGFTQEIYSVRFALVGRHVESIHEPVFDYAQVKYDNLKWLIYDSRMEFKVSDDNRARMNLDLSEKEPLLTCWLDESIRYEIQSVAGYTLSLARNNLVVTQETDLAIGACKPISLAEVLNLVGEFSMFLSIALWSKQFPREIKVTEVSDCQNSCNILFGKEDSVIMGNQPIIKSHLLGERLSQLLFNWHEVYNDIQPICRHLLNSINHKIFDDSDFLIIAQALDGYYKRFVAKGMLKQHRKYEDGIKDLLRLFDRIEYVQRCEINPHILAVTRNKYSHLIPDDDPKYACAARGHELFRLTAKCKVLLTCCILHCIGMTQEEINANIKESAIKNSVDSLFWE